MLYWPPLNAVLELACSAATTPRAALSPGGPSERPISRGTGRSREMCCPVLGQGEYPCMCWGKACCLNSTLQTIVYANSDNKFTHCDRWSSQAQGTACDWSISCITQVRETAGIKVKKGVDSLLALLLSRLQMTLPLEDLMRGPNHVEIASVEATLRGNGHKNALALLLASKQQSAAALDIWQVVGNPLTGLQIVSNPSASLQCANQWCWSQWFDSAKSVAFLCKDCVGRQK